MLDGLFQGIFDSASTQVIALDTFLLCVGVSLAIGLMIAFTASWRSGYSRSFLATLTALPVLSCGVIMMVNGNIGAGVATAGAFSLVRFRSATGTAREIMLIFLALVTGLMTGMGYLAYAVLFALILCALSLLLNVLGGGKQESKTLRITIPEDLDYDGVFDGVLNIFCKSWKLQQVKTIQMGSLYRLTYQVTLRPRAWEKEMIDQLRCRNGNLEINLFQGEEAASEL